jgi:predicted Zn-ribbon and HTH transcriptional regulator
MNKKMTKKISFINNTLREITEIFGVESVEYERAKTLYEQSFKIGKISNATYIAPKVSYEAVTESNLGYYQMDVSNIPRKEESKYYEYIDKIYKKYRRMGSVIQMANKYAEVTGITFRDRRGLYRKAEQIKSVSKRYYEFNKDSDEVFYLASKGTASGEAGGFFEEIEDETVKEKIVEILKSRRNTTGVEAERLYYQAKNLALETLLKQDKEKKKNKSDSRDTAKPYNVETVTQSLRVRGSRRGRKK